MTISRLRTNSVGVFSAPAVITSGGSKNSFTGNGTNGVNGQNYDAYTFTTAGAGTLVVASGGWAEVFMISGGGQGNNTNYWGGAGAVAYGWQLLLAGSIGVVVGLGGGQSGNATRYGYVSSLDTYTTGRSPYTDNASLSGLVGAGATNATPGAAFTTLIDGTSTTYGLAGQASPRANKGDGASNGNGSNGIVIVRVAV